MPKQPLVRCKQTRFAEDRIFNIITVVLVIRTLFDAIQGNAHLIIEIIAIQVNSFLQPIELDDTDWELVAGEQIPEGDIEIGYILKKSAWGKGYATEACNRLLKFAFEETPLQEVVAVIDAENTASRKVLEKCGLSYQGQVRSYAGSNPGFRIHPRRGR